MEGYQVDELKLYVGSEIRIADGIVIKTPQIGEIIEYGESSYFNMAQTLTATPSSMKVALDDIKLDWMQMDDFQLFQLIAPSLPQKATEILLGDLDLTTLKPYPKTDTGEIVLSNEDHTIEINEVIYNILVTYLRKMHGFSKQVDKAGNAITHKVLLDLARQDAKMAQNKPYKSFLKPVISAVKCRQGYTMEYIRNMGIFELFDDLNRLNIIVQADAALQGSWSGMVDTKKIDKSIFDWTREITEESKTKGKSVVNEGAN
jgi:hypothetical protein